MHKDDSNNKTNKQSLSAKSTWLEGYSTLLSNGFVRKITKVWKRDGKVFTSNKDALEYMKKLIGGS